VHESGLVVASAAISWDRGAVSRPDLNLLVTLDAVLAEGSVTGAARRLGLSPSAMSRALARLRETTGDPLLVRAGRGLVPTPRALELRERVGRVVQDAEAVLRPAEEPDLTQLERTFTLRTSEGFVENFGPDLIARVEAEAPRVRLRFVQKPDKEAAPLREGGADLETGVIEPTTGPELRAQALFSDRLVGAVREGHALAGGRMTRSRYLRGRHISVAREGVRQWPIDDSLEALGLEREVVTTVAGFATAVGLARASDLIATVPDRHTANLRDGMHTFPLPVSTPEFTVSLLWHPRLDADPAHRWLRGVVRAACAGLRPPAAAPRAGSPPPSGRGASS
jgi:DNA-binding transcriptional LysR family regulator